MLHIHYLMTCSEYVASVYHTDINQVMTAFGKCLRKLVHQKMEGNRPEIDQYTTYLFGWHDDLISTSEHCA